MGITKGDPVTIYMPMIPQVVIAMLACAGLVLPIVWYSEVFPQRPEGSH
ncbi:hypothetical protein N752_20850 [Desulforamulus aquiferis]|nr:hypothetical protein N752_20850 [Desulforamulus aquiferis]